MNLPLHARAWLGACSFSILAGCATLPPGADYPKTHSTAVAQAADTRIGRALAAGNAAHPGHSGFKLLPVGIDSFLLRIQMARAAERTLDVQYFLIQSDNSGQLLIEALLAAADRGVRVRVLLDDAGSFGRDAQVRTLAGYPNVELRLFNPFFYRGSAPLLHLAEYVGNAARLHHRMHNKLFVVDNQIGIVGGRNIGDEYFQGGSDVEFGDYDVITAGPVVPEISASFDAFWNSPLAVPIEALAGHVPSARDLDDYRGVLAAHHAQMIEAKVPYMAAAAGNALLDAMLAGTTGLVWAKAEVVYDSPEKASVEAGEQHGQLLRKQIGHAARQVRGELIVVSPYLIPGSEGMKFLSELRERDVRVSILTNSLASSDVPLVHSGYQAFREPLLARGVALYEVRPVLGRPVPGGKRLKSASARLFALHAKALVFDRERVFVGSMNLDQRSLHINTEIGLLIESAVLARQVAEHVAGIAQLANSYVLQLEEADASGRRGLLWRTHEDGKAVEYREEPAVTAWQRLQVRLLSLLPLDWLL
jgi:putative cardiolipin synthase